MRAVAAVILLAFSVSAQSAYQNAEMARQVARIVGVDESLFLAMIYEESGFRNCLTSRKGARGLGQLMPATARLYGLRVDSQVDERCNPWKNLHASARHLKDLLAEFGSADLALAAYNAGRGRVYQYGGVPPFAETRGYVKRIVGMWRKAQARRQNSSSQESTAQKKQPERRINVTVSLGF